MYHNDDIYNRLNGSTEAATEPEFAGPTFKMLLVGDGNVGKSAFVNRTLTGGFVPHAYEATMGGVIDGCDFHTNFGTVRFEICDIAGQDKRSGCRDMHYEGAQCAIIMFDVTSPRSYESVARWRSEIQRVCGAALPIVVCGNKVDADDEFPAAWLRSKLQQFGSQPGPDLEFYISAAIGHNCEKPFLHLARKLTGEGGLIFASGPAGQRVD